VGGGGWVETNTWTCLLSDKKSVWNPAQKTPEEHTCGRKKGHPMKKGTGKAKEQKEKQGNSARQGGERATPKRGFFRVNLGRGRASTGKPFNGLPPAGAQTKRFDENSKKGHGGKGQQKVEQQG